MKLTIKQTKALDYLEDNITEELLFGGGAGGGKSAFGVYWLMKVCLKYPGSRWLMGRAVLKTLKETTLNSFFQIAKLQGLKADLHYRYNAQSQIIYFANGSEVLLKDLFAYPSDPEFDELGSLEITGAFIDECNQVTEKAWNIVKSRIRYKLDEFGLIPKMLGTCNPSKSFVYGRFFKPDRDGSLPDNRKFIQSLLTDNPYISKHYRESLAQMDQASKERLLFGNWEYDNDPNALIEFSRISDLWTNDFVSRGKKFITVDVARYGSDSTVIMVWDGLRCENIRILQQSSIKSTGELVQELRKVHNVPMSCVIADADGVGGGLVDIIGCEGFVNNARPIDGDNFANLKSQCYFMLADKINAGEIYISDASVREKLTEELEQVKQKDVDTDGKRAIVSKDQVKALIGRSPDISDCLMFRMYFELNKPNSPKISFVRRR
jgi:phage terminase large subunit